MKKLLLNNKHVLFTISFTLIFLSNFTLAKSSFSIDTIFVQEKMEKVPSSQRKDAHEFGSFIKETFKDEPSRAFAISYWLATNIDYDFKSFVERRIETYSPNAILKKKKALCGEFASLFKVICDSAGLNAIVVDGYIKDFDFVPNDTLFRAEHTWNVVKINDKWQLLDLTFATGSYIPKDTEEQELEDMGLIPYSSNSKFIKRFNPQWIFVDPTEMIYTHYPAFKDLQLLQQPVPIDSFRMGEDAISNCLRINADTLGNSPRILSFYKKPLVDKYFFIGDEGLNNNKFDHRIKGLAYLNAIENINDVFYDPTKKIYVGCSRKDLKRFNKYIKTADSTLKINLKDNELEYRQLQVRSQNWKMALKTKNREHNALLKDRLRANNNDIKLTTKIYQKGIIITQYLNEKKATFLTKSLDNVRRPKREDPSLEAQSKLLMKSQEKLKDDALGLLFKIENIVRSYKKSNVKKRCEQEKKSLKIHRDNINTLDKIAKVSKNNSYLVHIPTTNVEKEWLKETIILADEINKKNIDTMLIDLYNSELELYNLIKQYTGVVKERLNILKQLKKSSIKDQNEDQIFKEAIDNYADNLLSYHFELKTFTMTKELIEASLEEENKKITEVIDHLQKESNMENDRHKNYMLYRKEIKNAENTKTKLALKRLIKLKTIIDKSIILTK